METVLHILFNLIEIGNSLSLLVYGKQYILLSSTMTLLSNVTSCEANITPYLVIVYKILNAII